MSLRMEDPIGTGETTTGTNHWIDPGVQKDDPRSVTGGTEDGQSRLPLQDGDEGSDTVFRLCLSCTTQTCHTPRSCDLDDGPDSGVGISTDVIQSYQYSITMGDYEVHRCLDVRGEDISYYYCQ